MSWKNFSPKEAEGADVVVIGSGMSGLCCAALLGKRGKRVVVLEQHDIAGGSIHSFKQGTEWVSAGWHYVGLFRGIMKVIWDDITDGQGMKETPRDEVIDTNYGYPPLSANTYEEAMGGIPVKQFRRVSDFWTYHVIVKLAPAIVAVLVWGWFWLTGKLKEGMMPYGKWCHKHAKAWTDKTKDNEVWWTQRGDHGMPKDQTTAIVGCAVAGHYARGTFSPEGGVYETVVRMCKTIKARGGSVLVKAKVDEIALTDAGAVKGVVVGKTLVLTKQVVVAGAWTITQLLPKAKVPKGIQAVVDKSGPSPQHGCVFLTFANETRESLGMPTGQVWYQDQYFFSHKASATGIVVYCIWESSYFNRGPGYEDRKEAEAKAATDVLYSLYPKIKAASEKAAAAGADPDAATYDASTPATTQHYLESWKGSSYGLAVTKARCGDYATVRALKPEVDGVKGLFLTGQDVVLPGVSSAMMEGALTAQAVLNPGWKGLFSNLLVDLGKEAMAKAKAAKKTA